MKTPFYILILCVVLFISSIVVLDMSKKQLAKGSDRLDKYTQLSTKYKTLKDNWADSDLMLRKVDSIIKYVGINNADITKTANDYRVTIAKIDIKTSHKLINKLLNENINLSEISISRDKVSFVVGIIKWVFY